MAFRPVYIAKKEFPFIEEKLIEFTWHPGFSFQQKQRNIAELHSNYKRQEPVAKTLEVSTKSTEKLGVALSAFNLKVTLKNGSSVALENLFQASKVFELGGPYKDLLECSPLEAKRDERLKNSGNLKKFDGEDKVWPLEPKTLYYDWIYMNAVHSNKELKEAVKKFNSFTDIEFNPKKSFNCQARSVALYISLYELGEIDKVISDSEYYIKLMSSQKIINSVQGSLFT